MSKKPREFVFMCEHMGGTTWTVEHQWAIEGEAQEVVRCRDCIHCEEAINGKALCERFSMEGSSGTLYPTVEWDGFCAWGERA